MRPFQGRETRSILVRAISTRGREVATRHAHNVKIVGANPTPAIFKQT